MKNPREDMGKYEDMLFLSHHVSQTHPQMSLENRAAQFSPFAALTGYEAAIRETGRLTQGRAELSEDEREGLDGRLLAVQASLRECRQPKVSIRYFKADEHKDGGAYCTVSGTVKRIDRQRRVLVFADGTSIPLDDIAGISGGLFSDF